MALSDLAKPKTATTGTGLRGLAGLGNTSNKKPDISTVEGLVGVAKEAGLGKQAEEIASPEKKLSFLQRLGTGLSALNPAEALLTGKEKGAIAGAKEYAIGAAKAVGSAITGKDYGQSDRRFFKDVAKEFGIENKIAQFGVGFVGDVLLDPSTYFGGAIARGITAGTKATASTALKGVGKVAPDVETGLRMAGTGLQDAVGKAFQYGYKATKGAKEDVLSFLSKEQKAKIGLAASNLDRLGTGVLTQTQREELALKMIAGKRAEFAQRELSEGVAKASEFFQPIKRNAEKMIATRQSNITKLQREIAKLENKGLEKLGKSQSVQDFVDDLIQITDDKYESLIRSIARKIDTREGWINDILKEVSKLRGEYKIADDLQKADLKLADNLFAQKGAVAREAAKSSDPVVQKAIEEQAARGKKFAEAIDVENPYETYFPFIKKDKVERFLNETKGIKVGSEGYKKQFKNLLTNENMELDPAKAFFTREAQVVSDKMTRDFLQGFVDKYGKKLDDFANVDEAAKAGFRPLKEKGVLFGKDLGYVNEFDYKLLRDSISPEFQTVNMLAKATGFDALTSLFKRSVTGLFAPFHIRNYMSGHIQNFETLGVDALNPRNISIGQKVAYLMGKNNKLPSDVIELGGRKMKFNQMMKPFIDRFSGDTFYNADFDLALKNSGELKSVAGVFSKQRVKETLKTAGLGQEAIPFKVGRAVGQFIEHQQKATAYVTALSQGKSIKEALALAEVAGFDYRALTRFESQIMRRIVPFYSFTRKNIELQLKTLGENPERINQVIRFFGNIGEPISDEERKNLPEFIRESLGVKLQDSPEGLKQYISTFGTPIEAFTSLFGSNPILRAISMTNPLIKAPVEIGIGKDSFRQRDLKDVYDAREYKLAPQIIKDMLEIKEVKKPIYKTINGKSTKVGERVAYIADPVKLLIARSLFTSRGISYLDQVFGNDLKGLTKLIKTTTGVKPQQVDIESQKFFSERDKKQALEDLLTRYAVGSKYEKFYLPSNRSK